MLDVGNASTTGLQNSKIASIITQSAHSTVRGGHIGYSRCRARGAWKTCRGRNLRLLLEPRCKDPSVKTAHSRLPAHASTREQASNPLSLTLSYSPSSPGWASDYAMTALKIGSWMPSLFRCSSLRSRWRHERPHPFWSSSSKEVDGASHKSVAWSFAEIIEALDDSSLGLALL
jgi:hypothetical protein